MKVFISHSSHDKWIARQISRLLADAGFESFLDEKDIKTGDSIDDSIHEHLKDSDDLLVLISPASLKSQWVFIEIGAARALDKRIVPITFHVEPNEIPSAISRFLAKDINQFDQYIDELKERQSGKKEAAEPAKKTTAKKTTSDGFTIGELVEIIDLDLLTDDDKNQTPKWVSGMNKYSGAEAEITKIFWDKEGDPDVIVNLSVDDEKYKWGTQWLRKKRS